MSKPIATPSPESLSSEETGEVARPSGNVENLLRTADPQVRNRMSRSSFVRQGVQAHRSHSHLDAIGVGRWRPTTLLFIAALCRGRLGCLHRAQAGRSIPIRRFRFGQLIGPDQSARPGQGRIRFD